MARKSVPNVREKMLSRTAPLSSALKVRHAILRSNVQAVREARIGRLVDHIPVIALPTIMGHDIVDVRLDDLGKSLP
jgi:hypothetical protein